MAGQFKVRFLHPVQKPGSNWDREIRDFIALSLMQRKFTASIHVKTIIVSPDKSWGYLGFSTVPLPPQRFPFTRDNLKNIIVRPLKFGMWVYMGNVTNAMVFDHDLQFQGHWWPLKGQVLPIFSHCGPVLIYRKLDRPMAGIYNTYICPL